MLTLEPEVRLGSGGKRRRPSSEAELQGEQRYSGKANEHRRAYCSSGFNNTAAPS